MPKKSIERDKLHLLQIRDAIEKIEYYVDLGKKKQRRFASVKTNSRRVVKGFKMNSKSKERLNPSICFQKKNLLIQRKNRSL